MHTDFPASTDKKIKKNQIPHFGSIPPCVVVKKRAVHKPMLQTSTN